MAIFNPYNFKKMKSGQEGEICIKGYKCSKILSQSKKTK